MPTTGNVEERIVEMRIDHEKFEAGAKKTISILEKLDEGLRSVGKNNADGFDDIADSLSVVERKFSVLGTIGDQVIRNLTNKAMALVSQMGKLNKALTVDQIGAGWNKYAEKTSSVQTIMAATSGLVGERFADQEEQMKWVSEQLKFLNSYTDETSYNFTDMVNNIGKFTSAGVELETAVTAMQGIANWGAVSGANVEQVSRAMYNLSQAMGTGSVKLIDWKSIENANMATVEFKEAALESAVALGQLKKVGVNTYKTLGKKGVEVTAKTFNASLAKNWFNSEVLLKTLELYGGFSDIILQTKENLGLEIYEIKNLMDAYESSDPKEFEKALSEVGKTAKEVEPWIKQLTDADYELGRKAFFAAQEAKTFQEAVDATKDAVATGWLNIFEKMFGNYMEAKELWSEFAEQLFVFFVEPVNKLNRIFELVFGEGFESEEELASAAEDVAAAYNNIEEALNDAHLSMSDFEEAFKEVDSATFDKLIAEYGSLDQAIKNGAVDAETFKRVIRSLISKNTGISLTFSKFGKKGDKKDTSAGSDYNTDKAKREAKVKKRLEVLYKLLDNTDEVLGNMAEKGEAAEKTIGGVVAHVKGRVLLKESIINILQFINDLKDNIVAIKDEIFGITEKGTAEKIYNILEKFHAFTVAIQFTEEKTESFKNTISSIFGTLFSVITVIGGIAGKVLSSAISFIVFLISNIIKIITNSGILQAIFLGLLMVIEGLIAPVRIIINYFKELNAARKEQGKSTWVETLTKAFSTLSGYITSAANKFKEFMSSSKVTSFILAAVSKVTELFGKALGFISSIITRVRNLVKLIKVGYMKNGLAGVFSVLSIHYKKLIKDHPTLFKIFTFIQNVVSKITSLVSSGYSAVSKWFSSIDFSKFTKYLPTLESLQKLIQSFKDAFHGDFSGIKEWWSGIVTKIQDSLESIKTAFANLNIKEIVKTFFNNIIEGFKNNTFLSELIASLKQRFGGIGEKIKSAFNKIFGNFSLDSEKLKKLVSTLKTLMPLFVGGGLILTIHRIGQAFEEIEGVAWMIEKKQFMNGLKKVSNMVVKLAVSLVLVASALKIVSTIPSDKILDSLLTLLALLSALVRAAMTINNVPNINGKKNAKKVKGLIALAVSVLLAAVALKIISTIDTARLLSSWLALSALLIDLIIFTNLAGNVKKKGLGRLIGVAFALVAIIGVIWILAKMPIEDFLKGWLMLNALFVSIIGFTLFSGNVKRKGLGELWKVAIALLLIVRVLEKLSKFDFGTFLKSWIMLKFILSSMATFTRRSRSIKGKGLGGLIAVVISIWALTGVLKKLGSLSLGSILKGWIGIELLLLSISGFINRISKITKIDGKGWSPNGLKGKGLFGLYTVVIAVFALASVLKNLSSLSLGGILKGWIGIELILLSISGFINRISKTDGLKGKGVFSLIVVVLSVAALVEVLIRLSAYDMTSILRGWSGIALVMRSMRNFIKQTSGAQFNLKSIFVLLEVAFVVVVIMQVLIRLSRIKAKKIAGPVAAIIACLLTIARSIKIISSASKGIKFGSILALAAGVVAFIAIAQMLIKLTEYDFTGATRPVLLAILTLYAITGAIALMGAIGPGVMAKGIAGLAIIAVGLTLIIGAIIGIGIGIVNMANTLADKLKSFIDKLKPFIESVGELTGANEESMRRFATIMKLILEASFWGAIASVLAHVMEGLDLATNLKNFMDNFKPFLNGVLVCINPFYLLAVQMLEKIMLAILGATFWGAIASIFASVISGSNLAKNLSTFITNLKPFLTEVAKLTDDDKTNVERLSTIMGAIVEASFWGALASILQYLISNERLPNTLTTFIQNLWPFFDEVIKIKPIHTMRVRTFAATMQAITEATFWAGLANLLSHLSGKNTIVGAKLSKFIQDLQPFFKSVLTITNEHLVAVQQFAEVMKGVAATEFWKFVAEFLDGFSSFLGNKMAGNAEAESGTEVLKDDMEAMGDVADGAAEFGDKMSAIGNLGQKLSTFIEDLKPFLEATKALTEEDVSGVSNFGTIMQTIAMSEMWTSLADLLDKIVNSKLVLKLGEGTGTFFERAGDLVDSLGPFLDRLKNETNIGSKTVTRVQRFGEIIKALAIGDIWTSFADMIDALMNPDLKTDVGDRINGTLNGVPKLQTFGERLNALAADIIPFLSTIKGNVTEDDKTSAQNFGEVLKALAAGEFWGKVAEIIGGLNEDIGGKFSGFMSKFKKFITNLGVVKPVTVTQADNLSQVLEKLSGTSFWAAIGDWIDDWGRGDRLENFGTKLSTFSTALKPFLDMMSEYEGSSFSNASELSQFLLDLAGKNALAWFANDIAMFYSTIGATTVDVDWAVHIMEVSVDFINSIIRIYELLDNTTTTQGDLMLFINNILGDTANDATIIASATSVGENIGAGIAQGIYNEIPHIVRAARLAGIAATNAYQNVLDIHSPSRVFMRLSEYIPEGIALGIEKNTRAATDSVTILGTGIITAMQMAMARVATVADESFEFNPVITPVVDMTNIDTAVGNAGSMFGTVSSTMRGSIQVAADNAQLLASVANNSSSSSSILDEMRSLSDHLDELGDAVASMQIVLDTGVLVGATSHQMDNAFGTMQARRGRGN